MRAECRLTIRYLWDMKETEKRVLYPRDWSYEKERVHQEEWAERYLCSMRL